MRLPIMLAHGDGLIGYLFIALIAGAIGLICLVAAGVVLVTRGKGDRRLAGKFFLAFIGCVLLILLAPLFSQLLHLP